MKTHSEKFLKQRRFYMVLPVLVLPFLSMIFWALGGGKVMPAEAKAFHTGLDMSLPDAYFPKEQETWNKLNYYEQAEKDSLQNKKARENDPYYSFTALREPPSTSVPDKTPEPMKSSSAASAGLNLSVDDKSPKDPMEEKVNQKLQLLYEQMNAPAQEQPIATIHPEQPRGNDEAFSQDVARLEKMMEVMNPESAPDPEMEQLQSVLDKILDIQHPERAKEKIRQQSLAHEQQVYPVASHETSVVSLFPSNAVSPAQTDTTMNQAFSYETEAPNGFFDITEDAEEMQPDNAVIQAIIHDTQELMAGAEVKIRLLQDVYLNGKLIPKDEVVYGACAVNGDRFTISISAIAMVPVSLKVYDLTGMEGIYVPGSITQDAVRQGTNQAIQSLQLYNGLDASLETQVASAGVQAAKGLFAKKARVAKGIVKAGYRIVLRDGNQM
jgi:conjugative transposon TraM protein